jgi:hypothetical protein
MQQTARCEQLRELIDTELPTDEFQRLARIDALLRVSAPGHEDEAASLLPRVRVAAPSEGRSAPPLDERPPSDEGVRPMLSVVTTPPAASGSTPRTSAKQTHGLKLTFSELVLIHKSLQAVKTLGALPLQDELLNDTIELVDQALNRSV